MNFKALPQQVQDEAYQMRAMACDDLENAFKGMSDLQSKAYLSAMLDYSVELMVATAPKEVVIEYLKRKLTKLENP